MSIRSIARALRLIGKPGTDYERVKVDEAMTLSRKALRSIRRDKLTLIALTYLLALTVISLLAPVITDHIMQVDPNEPNSADIFAPPMTEGYILGADDIGRDQLARLLHASGVSMAIGFFGSLFTLVIGVFFGMLAGYSGKRVDDLLNWVVTTFDSIPALFLLLLFASIFSFNAWSLVLVISIVAWPGTYRLIRGQTIAIRATDYVLAAQALGASRLRIILVHILPNLFSFTVVSLMLGIAGLILLESALSYLGFGVQPPQATWGNMLNNSFQYFRHGPHLIIFPILMISVTVLCFYIVGDGIRDAFDPTLQR